MASKHLPRRAKTKGGLEKCLANPGSRQKITKTTHAVRGLQTKWEIQVSMMFGPWTDWCLWCWKNYPGNSNETTLILAKDYYPLNVILKDEHDKIEAGKDWGKVQLQKDWKIGQKTIFRPIQGDTSNTNFFKSLSACKGENNSFNKYIGENRLLIWNIWPYFRRGTVTSGSSNIPDAFTKFHSIKHWLNEIISKLKVTKIATWGSWAYTNDKDDISYFKKSFLKGTSQIKVAHFFHPGYRKWTGNAFEQFLKEGRFPHQTIRGRKINEKE